MLPKKAPQLRSFFDCEKAVKITAFLFIHLFMILYRYQELLLLFQILPLL